MTRGWETTTDMEERAESDIVPHPPQAAWPMTHQDRLRRVANGLFKQDEHPPPLPSDMGPDKRTTDLLIKQRDICLISKGRVGDGPTELGQITSPRYHPAAPSHPKNPSTRGEKSAKGG